MLTRFRILVVDDDPTVADLLNRAAVNVFPQAQFEHAVSFSQAVDYFTGLNGYAPNLVLLDINLEAEKDGYDLLSLIRAHPQGCLLPTVVLTGNHLEETGRQAYQRGASAYTRKPFSFEGWIAYVKNLHDYWYKTATVPKLMFEDEWNRAIS
ncbi:response regulator [Spirosoma knui]